MDFFTAIRICLSKYADFTGRATRSEYWWFVLAVFIGMMICMAIAQSLARDDLPLEKALALFEEGIAVLQAATESLSRAEARVATLVERANGVLEVAHDDE